MKVLSSTTLFLLASFQATAALDGYDQVREGRKLSKSRSKSSKGGCSDPSSSNAGDEMDRFKEENHLMPESDPSMQMIDGDSFMLGEKKMSLADSALEPIDIFTADAKVMVDGVEEPASPCVFKGIGDEGSIIAKDSTGKLVLASSTDPVTGKTVNVIPMEPGSEMYAMISSDDVDDDVMSQFLMKDVAYLPGRGLQHSFAELDNRTLEVIGDCDFRGYDVMEVAIVVDSYLCAHKGGKGTVGALAQSIVAGASKMYEASGLCKKLKISHLEIHCDPSSDPIRPLVVKAGDANVCDNSSGLLRQFLDYIRSQGITADVNHLLHGWNFPKSHVVGCAYVGTVCEDNGSNTAVNQIDFSNVPSLQYILLAHENGHICSAGHVEDGTTIMNPYICGTCNSFHSASKDSINTRLAARSCTHLEGALTDAPTGAPTVSPTEAPTLSPTESPTEAPTRAPTPTPTYSPTVFGAQYVRIEVQHDTYPEETGWKLIDTETNATVAGQEQNTVFVYGKFIDKDLMLPPGSYEFQITDSYGDGICCRYGPGWFKIYVDGELLVDHDGKFSRSTSVSFEVIAPPTMSPTLSPTASPTAAPTSVHYVELEVQHDTYPEETGWTLMDADTNAIIASQDENTVFVYGELVEEEFALPSGTYEFQITDSYGDGICCRYGPGWFKIYVDGELLVDHDGKFSHETVETFQVGGS